MWTDRKTAKKILRKQTFLLCVKRQYELEFGTTTSDADHSPPSSAEVKYE
jgi:hypothetical protein